CASQHIGARWLVKLDLHDFFGSVRERRVYPIFFELGYPPLLSLELTRLCTRAELLEQLPRSNDKYRGKAPYSLVPEGSLPQGAPTSGALANMVMRTADAALADYASRQGLTYTRYSDDITFSAGADFSRDRARDVVNRAASIVGREGFRL